MIDQVKLTPDSSEVAFDLAAKFKELGKDLLPPKQVETHLVPGDLCEACDSIEAKEYICPVSDDLTFLCFNCYEARRKIAAGIKKDREIESL